jgi:hypothetical protein
MRAN